MQKIETEVLVIGGGATGTGVTRDLAMRGFSTILVEKRDLSHGTTGRYHGLLHSGGRYVVKDPLAARECMLENKILKHISPQCIEETGGYFVITPWDDPDYVPLFLKGCLDAGITTEEVPLTQMFKSEPLLNPSITYCFRLPDASADSFLTSKLNALSARQYGGKTLTYHEVTHLLCENQRVIGAVCQNLVKDEQVVIMADLVVNAAGAWVGKLAKTINIEIEIKPGKGTLIALNQRITNTVVSRCKLPSDGDIIVPIHTVSVLGTTDIPVSDPDQISIDPWETQLILDEANKLIPGINNMRVLRVWAGVRPLFDLSLVNNSRDISRAFVLIDHESRDGVQGFVTITSGKWTTYRLMAQATADLVCQKLGTWRPCKTHLEQLPDGEKTKFHRLGAKLMQVEQSEVYGGLICECELVTFSDLIEAINKSEIITIDDIRRDLRLGMGPCQGCFCTYRAAGILHTLRQSGIEATNLAIRDFLQERWKGLVPLLCGEQLRQERFKEYIYRNILNAEHLPGPTSSPLSPESYSLPPKSTKSNSKANKQSFPNNHSLIPDLPNTNYPGTNIHSQSLQQDFDVIILGAGFSGLATALKSAKRGLKTLIITKGWGTTYWSAGCIDVLGYTNFSETPEIVASPSDGIQLLIHKYPFHPYSNLGLDFINQIIVEFQNHCIKSGYPMHGSLERNWFLPTSLGTIRPTCLAPETMVAGDLQRKEPMLIVGFEGYHDFFSQLIANNLIAQGVSAQGITIPLPSIQNQRLISSITLAQLFESQEFRSRVVQSIKSKIGVANRVGFPAVLGIQDCLSIKNDLESQLGCQVFEIPTMPPSVPGIRLHNLLLDGIRCTNGQVINGLPAKRAIFDNDRIVSIICKSSSRDLIYSAKVYVLATGGLLGGGIVSGNGYAQETVFNLPLSLPIDPADWFHNQFLSPNGHLIHRGGLLIDDLFHPLDNNKCAVYTNLHAAGSILAGCDSILERSLEGVSLATGSFVGERILSN